MTTRTRVAITLASTLALGLTSYGSTWTAGDPGTVPDLWNWGLLASYAFAILTVFLVNRWWALLPVFAPLAAGLYIHLGTDYVSPWASEEIRPATTTTYIALVALGIAIQAAVLSLGLLARRVWDWGRRARVNRRTRVPSPRG